MDKELYINHYLVPSPIDEKRRQKEKKYAKLVDKIMEELPDGIVKVKKTDSEHFMKVPEILVRLGEPEKGLESCVLLDPRLGCELGISPVEGIEIKEIYCDNIHFSYKNRNYYLTFRRYDINSGSRHEELLVQLAKAFEIDLNRPTIMCPGSGTGADIRIPHLALTVNVFNLDYHATIELHGKQLGKIEILEKTKDDRNWPKGATYRIATNDGEGKMMLIHLGPDGFIQQWGHRKNSYEMIITKG